MANVQGIILTESGTIIYNPGSVFSEPAITIHGSGTIVLMIGLRTVTLERVNDSMTVDTALREAYKGTTLMNEKMNGDFPVLKPGPNAISWMGDVSRIVVTPNWRFL